MGRVFARVGSLGWTGEGAAVLPPVEMRGGSAAG